MRQGCEMVLWTSKFEVNEIENWNIEVIIGDFLNDDDH